MEAKEEKLYRQIPVVAIRGSVVFPFTDAVLSFGRKKSVAAVNAAFQEDKVIGVFTQKETKVSDPSVEDLYKVGTIAVVTQMMSTEGEIHAVVKGQARIKLHEIIESEPYLVAKVEEIKSSKEEGTEIEAIANKLTDLFKKAINLGKQAEIMAVMKLVSGIVDPQELADQIASLLDLKTEKKQELLETESLGLRLNKVFEYLSHEVNVLEIEKTISTKTQKRFEDQMRKAMLREKKRTIEKELGEFDEDSEVSGEEMSEYKKRIKAAKMPKNVLEKANKELKRLSQMSPNNPEGGYIRNYLDWLCDMPWSKVTPNNVSISKDAKVLENEHYGIKKVKERILEYLAVMQLRKHSKKDKKEHTDSHPTILCFMGPPGVGKTSIGKSIAKSLGREFVRISLGGIRDEAEIRGHRRTYVGALPGRIVQGIKNAGSKNPVFMLDEIDKIGVDFRGDPSSALLEALDPEQNREFSDHYLEVPFDLSEVMFICTGNVLENIPGPLRDRMEVINFAGYTQDEKFNIAKEFLFPKQLKIHGLESKKIDIDKKSLNEVIEKYTREAGVRDLERNLATLCRKIARQIAENKTYPRLIKSSDVEKFLGPRKFNSQIAEKNDEIGMSTGMAVTASGGEILFIEVALMPGDGKLTLTGKLGSVMKESAKAAFTWARAHYHELGVKEDFGRKIDIHVHVPEGAVPKDGPSAGTAMATAIASAISGIPVKREVAMTGEVTLRGRVMEIGGLKEKVIAAHRAGIKTVIAPKDNEKDMEDIPAKVKKDIKFVFTSKLNDVLSVALQRWPAVKVKKSSLVPRPGYLIN